MQALSRPAQMVLRVTGLFQLLSGIFLWSNHVLTWLPLHLLSGVLFVLALWALSAAALRPARPMALIGFLWGLVTAGFGLVQTGLVSGGAHWTIQVAHLVIGIVAIGLGEMLAGRIKRRAGGPA